MTSPPVYRTVDFLCSCFVGICSLPLEHGHSRKHKVSGSHPSALGHSSSKLWSPEERETSLTYDQSHDDISDIVTPRSSQPRPLAIGSEDVFVSPPASSLQQVRVIYCGNAMLIRVWGDD